MATTQGKIESVSRVPFAGTKHEIRLRGLSMKGKYCSPEYFQKKATSHRARIDANIPRVIDMTLVEVQVTVPVDPNNTTANDTLAIDAGNANHSVFTTAKNKLLEFLITSVKGIPYDIIVAMGVNGASKKGKKVWDVLMTRNRHKEITMIEAKLMEFKVDVYSDMEYQIAKFQDLVGQISLHPDGQAMADRALIIKFMSKILQDRAHLYTQEMRDQKKS
jgi:hypothetical protein